MRVIDTKVRGVVIIEPRLFGDGRGFLLETWNLKRYADSALPDHFVQDNLSSSLKGVLRGLHFQNPFGQGKLVTALRGEVFDVAVDIRVGSPTYGQWQGVTLSDETMRQIYIPPGCAHGFVVLSETALVSYKCTEYYSPRYEASLLWDDPDLGIEWPVKDPILSAKDRDASRLSEIPTDLLPRYDGP
jgi:dTDP-4-dehydrorhamnose 3,5-epimerase